jgi:cell division protein FtsB
MATRELKTRITADNSDLKRGLKDSEKQVSGFSSTVKKAGVALLGVFAAKELAQGIKRIVVDLGNMADRLLDLEQITGISTDKLQEYEQVARVAGVNSETLATAVQGLTRRLAATDTATSPLNIGLGKLGITAKTAAGEIRNGAEVMEEAIAKLAEMDNVTERNVLGAQIFGRAWMDLAPILALGADGIEKARREAHELGLVLDKEALEKANQFRIELETLNRQLSQIGKNIGMAVIPALTKFISKVGELIKPTTMSQLEKFTRLLFGGFYRVIGMKGAASILLDPVSEAYREQYDELTKIQNKRDEINRKINELESSRAVLARRGSEATESELAAIELIVDKQKELSAERDLLLQQIKELKSETEDAVIIDPEPIEDAVEKLEGLKKLRDDLAKAEEKYASARTEDQAAYWLTEMNNIQAMIDAWEQAARGIAAARKQSQVTEEIGAPQRVQGIQGGAIPLQGFDPQAIINQNLLTKALNETAEAQEKAALAAQKHAEMMQALSFIAQDAAFSIGEAFGQMAASGGRATAQLVNQAIAQAVAMIIRQIAATLPFPANIAAIASAGMFQGMMKSQIPAYRDGAIAYGPSLGMIGEYANASTNPEIIAPLDKLQGMLGGGTGEVEFRIKGQELWGVLKKYENRLNQNS